MDGPVRETAEALARLVPERGPHLTATLAWGQPCWSGHERVESVVAHARHSNLQLWAGTRLGPEKRASAR